MSTIVCTVGVEPEIYLKIYTSIHFFIERLNYFFVFNLLFALIIYQFKYFLYLAGQT